MIPYRLTLTTRLQRISIEYHSPSAYTLAVAIDYYVSHSKLTLWCTSTQNIHRSM